MANLNNEHQLCSIPCILSQQHAAAGRRTGAQPVLQGQAAAGRAGAPRASGRSDGQWWCGLSSARTSSSSASSLPACMNCSTAPKPVSRAAICAAVGVGA
jgi:hypothetical protein